MPNHVPPRSGRCSHKVYDMTCDDYDQLVDDADGRCQICRVAPHETNRGFLVIDHDAKVGPWAVRGLLCSDCNTAIPCGSAPGWARAYLASPWWRARGLPKVRSNAGEVAIAAVAAATAELAAATTALEAALLAALSQPDAKPTKVAAASPWTPAYVRAFARKHGIGPDPAYAQRNATRKDGTADD